MRIIKDLHKKHEVFRTPLWVWKNLVKRYPFVIKGRILDPSAGHAEVTRLARKLGNKKEHTVIDIREEESEYWKDKGLIKRLGKENCIIGDFLDIKIKQKYDSVISNPPFSLAVPFVEKSLKLLKDGGHVTFLQRLDFLASQKRAVWFEQTPPMYVLVLTKRPTWIIDNKLANSSDARDYALFIWQKGYTGETMVRWLFIDKVINDVPIVPSKPKKRFQLYLKGKKS